MTSEEAIELTKATYGLKVAIEKSVHRMDKLAMLYDKFIKKEDEGLSVCPECQEVICECKIMDINKAKKMLYKEKPMANRFQRLALSIVYTTYLSDGSLIRFRIPKNEAEGFSETEPAQLLIRWMI